MKVKQQALTGLGWEADLDCAAEAMIPKNGMRKKEEQCNYLEMNNDS